MPQRNRHMYNTLTRGYVNNEKMIKGLDLYNELSPQIHDFNLGGDDNTNTGFEMSSGDDISGVSMSKVFSQLVKSEGR